MNTANKVNLLQKVWFEDETWGSMQELIQRRYHTKCKGHWGENQKNAYILKNHLELG